MRAYVRMHVGMYERKNYVRIDGKLVYVFKYPLFRIILNMNDDPNR